VGVRNVVAGEDDAALLRLVQTQHRAGERGLARARLADEADAFAGGHVEIDVREDGAQRRSAEQRSARAVGQ